VNSEPPGTGAGQASAVPAVAPIPPLSAFEVRVGWLRLDLPAGFLGELTATLSEEERHRAARFIAEPHRHRFIAARGQLRAALGRCLGTSAAEIELAYSATGKPTLAGTFATVGLHFNLSHSEDTAVFAVTLAGPVGIDVERIRRLRDFDLLVTRFFSSREQAAFLALPEGEKPGAFFHLWTRKEAWLKATGAGLAGGLDQVEVTFLPGEPARFLSLPGVGHHPAGWSLHDLAAPAGFAAAVAVGAPGIQPGPFL